MSAGTVTDSCANSVTATDNSCVNVRAALYQWQLDHGALWQPVSCSSDPVVVGTQVQYLHSISGASASCAITSISATASSSDAVTSDVNTVVTLMVIGVFFAFFYGFSSGKGFFK